MKHIAHTNLDLKEGEESLAKHGGWEEMKMWSGSHGNGEMEVKIFVRMEREMRENEDGERKWSEGMNG